MCKKRLFSSIVEIVIGIVLIIASMLEVVDEFWCGMGFSLFIIGVFYLVKAIKYKNNEEYREKCDIEISDERNRYISLKAWSWSGYLFVMAGGIGSIVFKIAGRDDLMMMASGCVCIVMIFYWISYNILSKKY